MACNVFRSTCFGAEQQPKEPRDGVDAPVDTWDTFLPTVRQILPIRFLPFPGDVQETQKTTAAEALGSGKWNGCWSPQHRSCGFHAMRAVVPPDRLSRNRIRYVTDGKNLENKRG